MFTLVSIIAASAIATAQTESAPATMTTPAATHEVKAEAKKVEKKKKTKKAKPTTSNTELKGSTTVTTSEAAIAPTATMNTASATITSPATTPAAGTSTATATGTAEAKNAFSGAVVVYPQAGFHSNNIQIWTTPGIKYNINDKLNVGVKQTFETLNNFNDDAATSQGMKDNNFRAAFTDFTISSTLSSSFSGLFGSNPMPISLNYKDIKGDALKMSNYGTAYGMIEGNLSVPYTVNAKVDFGIDTQIRHVIAKNGPNSNRFLAVPSLSYAFNDIVSVYQSAGYILSLRDNNELRRRFERMYLETGVNINPIKNLSIGMNVNQDKAISAAPSSGVDVTNFNLYNTTASANGDDATLDGVAYEAMITYKF